MDFKYEIGENGDLDDSVLKKIDTGQKLYIPAADSYMRMKKDAKEDGVTIQLVGEYSGYRPCGEKGDYLQRGCNTGFTQWCAWEKYKSGVGNPAANPTGSIGCTSNHGYGIAIDVKGSAAKSWIRKNGVKYGWWWGEAPTEDWHFTYDINKDTFFDKKNTPDTALENSTLKTDGEKKNILPIIFILIGVGGIAYYLIKTKTIKV